METEQEKMNQEKGPHVTILPVISENEVELLFDIKGFFVRFDWEWVTFVVRIQ